jgi:hypothetical protein
VYYPNVLTHAMLILPASAGLARVAKNRHWMTDVIGGAVIGGMTAHFLAENHRDTRESLSSGGAGGQSVPLIGLRYSF